MGKVPVGTRMRFLQAVPPPGWFIVAIYPKYIVCEYGDDPYKLPEDGAVVVRPTWGKVA